MAAIDKYADTYKSNTVVLSSLQRHVMRSSVEKDLERSDVVIHPSDFVSGSWCSRAVFYRIKGYESVPQPLSFRTMNIFAEGDDIHEKYQRWFREMGILWGDYLCKDCGFMNKASMGQACTECGSVRLKYKEYKLVHPGLLVQGSTDGVLIIDEITRLLEVKSVGLGSVRIEMPVLYDRFMEENRSLGWLWMNINAPFPSHLRQGMTYLFLARMMGLPVEEIIFIYEFKPTQEVKEFKVKYNEDIISKRLEEVLKLTRSLMVDSLPERPLWAESSHMKCKSCWFKSTCWEENAVDKPTKPRIKKANAVSRRKALGR